MILIQRKRILDLAVGVAAVVAVLVAMRVLASWRPQTVAIVNFSPTRIFFTRNGNRLVVMDEYRTGSTWEMYDWKKGAVDSSAESLKELDRDDYGETTLPHVWADRLNPRLVFSISPQQRVGLKGLRLGEVDIDGRRIGTALNVAEGDLRRRDNQGLAFGWSMSRSEVYGVLNGQIWVWDAKDGQVKRRLPFGRFNAEDVAFSPDGKWILAFEHSSEGQGYLWRYDVRSRKMKALVDKAPWFGAFGFSPDGKFIWFVRENSNESRLSFHVAPNTNAKINWGLVRSQACFGPSKWLADGRIGIVAESGFQWRDSSLRLLRRLPGPYQGRTTQSSRDSVQDWVLSPDGKWIYSCEKSGTVRLWRAR